MVMGEAGRITGFKFESLHTILEEKVYAFICGKVLG